MATMITLIDALDGAIDCKSCCIDTFLKMYKYLFQSTNQLTENDRQLLAITAQSLVDLQTNFPLYRTIVAKRLKKLNLNCGSTLNNTSCLHMASARNEIFVPLPSSSIPLVYRGFDIDWQDF